MKIKRSIRTKGLVFKKTACIVKGFVHDFMW